VIRYLERLVRYANDALRFTQHILLYNIWTPFWNAYLEAELELSLTFDMDLAGCISPSQHLQQGANVLAA